jgi:hypothetical protein
MKRNLIENSLERALNEAPSLNFNTIINTPYVKMKEHDFITHQTEAKAVSNNRHLAPVIVFCAVLLLCITGWYVQYRVPDSLITLDVNPSIAIITNKQDHIISIKALNEDSQKVLEEINDDSSDLDSIVASIINTMIDQGYLSNDKNVVMISVENKAPDKSELLASTIEQTIQDSALSQNITPQILKQTLLKNKKNSEQAKQYSVSSGKLKLILELQAALPAYSLNTLASMSMEELLDLAIDHNVNLQEIIQTVTPLDTKATPSTPTNEPNRAVTPPVKKNKINAEEDVDHDDSDDLKDDLDNEELEDKELDNDELDDDNDGLDDKELDDEDDDELDIEELDEEDDDGLDVKELDEEELDDEELKDDKLEDEERVDEDLDDKDEEDNEQNNNSQSEDEESEEERDTDSEADRSDNESD